MLKTEIIKRVKDLWINIALTLPEVVLSFFSGGWKLLLNGKLSEASRANDKFQSVLSKYIKWNEHFFKYL